MPEKIISTIQDVKVIPLKQFPDERGKIMHMLKCTDPHFKSFAEIHFSVAYPGVVKGWHRRPSTMANVAVIHGKVKWVLYDQREESSTHGELMEIFLSVDNYFLLQIPPDITSGYKTIGVEKSIVANCTDEVHLNEKKINIDPFDNDIPYEWDLVHR
jgi:dTDP-4-dehydrorhamnose 3,5-epimerase